MQIAKKIYGIVTTCLVVLVVIVAILLVGMRVFGLTPYTVLSGSMEPTYHVGSVIYVGKVSVDELKVGDPLTYTLDGTTVTHRIIEKTDDPLRGTTFRTQGDANDTPDGHTVTPAMILGKPLFSIPLLGYVSHFVQNPPGIYLAVGGCFVLVILTVLTDYLFPVDDKSKTRSSDEEQA